MKIKVITIMIFIISIYFAQANTNHIYDNHLKLGKMLGVPTNTTSQIWTSSLFAKHNIIITNNFNFVKQDIKIRFYHEFNLIISSNEQTVAHGKLWEETTYDDAIGELLHSLSNNNMMLEAIAGGLNFQTNNIGDFTLIRQKYIYLPSEIVTTNDFSELHFVRGAKAVSLHGIDGLDVRPIAETLDALLISPP